MCSSDLVPQRIDMLTYSNRFEPPMATRDKTGAAITVQSGLLSTATVAPVGRTVEVQLERGDAFAVPGDERNEN